MTGAPGWAGLARQGQINNEGLGGGKAGVRVGRDESGPTGRQAGGLSPALSALFNVPRLERVGGGARGAGAHLSQAPEEGAGPPPGGLSLGEWEECGPKCN